MATAHPFSCLTCQLAFVSSAGQRAHYATDLHRYNAKRKVANLPPVTAELFNDKIAEQRNKLAPASSSSSSARASGSASLGSSADKLLCPACKKRFSSENAYNDHLKSRRHREAVLKGVESLKIKELRGKQDNDGSTVAKGTQGTEANPVSSDSLPVASVDSTDQANLPSTSCLFCTRSFTDLDTNLKHMAHNHGFHIPDESYCNDIPGLLSQIAQDISLGNICITCGHGFGGLISGDESDAELVRRARKGLDSVRSHMISKAHTRLPWDTEEQRLRYSDHYDYRSSYPDYVPGEDDNDELSTPEMEIDEAEDEDWEDASDEEIDANDKIFMDYSAVRRKIRKPMEDDLDYRLAVANGDYELILPSGARVGHRALKGVYKQNVMPYIDLSEPRDKLSRLTAALEAKAARKEASSSALVQSNNGSLMLAKNSGEAKYARKATREFADARRIHDHRNKVAKVGNNQKHFRDPLLQ